MEQRKLSNLQADPENQFGLEKFWNEPIRMGNGPLVWGAVSRRGMVLYRLGCWETQQRKVMTIWV